MKKLYSYLFILFILLNSAYSFEIKNESKEIWNKFEVLYNEYLDKILKSTSIEEINKIEELYDVKIKAVLQEDIYIEYYQDKYVSENIINITSTALTDFYLSNGGYSCKIKVSFIAKTNILRPDYSFGSSSINATVNNKSYKFESIVIYDFDWKLLN